MDKLKFKLFSAEMIFTTILGLLIFVPACTIFYWQGWIYLLFLSISLLIMTLFFLKHDRALMERRVKIGTKAEKRKSQKVLKSVFFALIIGIVLLSSIDYRYGLSNVTTFCNIISYIMILFSFYVFYQVQKENSFASASIEVAKEQKVISTGPYSVVRHPMYSGALILFLFSPIALDSFFGMIPAIMCIVILIFRILDEEKYLNKNLSGYSDYCKMTRFRLVPYIW